MKLTVNGSALELPPEVATVSALLQHLRLNQALALVELNDTVITRQAHESTAVAEGDRLEILQFVGGG